MSMVALFPGVDDNILKPTDVNQSDPKKDIYGTYDKIRFLWL